MPDSQLCEAAERGEVAIGGCIAPDDPWPGGRCRDCARDVHLTEEEAGA